MRPSSNHKTPTVVPDNLWPTVGNIHIDYGEAYPGPATNAQNGKARIPPFQTRPIKEADSVHQTNHNKTHPTEAKLPTDYWNDSFFAEQSNKRQPDSTEKALEARDFEARYSVEDDSFDSDKFEDDSFDSDKFEDDSFEGRDYDYDEFESTHFDASDFEFGDCTSGNCASGDCDPGEFNAHDLDHLSNDLSRSLFSEGERSREIYSDRTGYADTPQRRIKQQLEKRLAILEQRLSKIVGTPHSTNYLTHLGKILEDAVSLLASARVPVSVLGSLQMARSLIKRYASRGLDALAVLEDVIELSPQENPNIRSSPSASLWTSLLVSLATRVVIQPRLRTESHSSESHRRSVSPALVQKLLGAITQSIKLLTAKHRLNALPGLATSIGHISVRDGHPLSQLPQQFYRAATKVVNNPQLYQRLCSVCLPKPAPEPNNRQPSRLAEARTETPQRLRLNGPVEIFIRPLGEN